MADEEVLRQARWRAKWALDPYMAGIPTAALQDLLCDLMHWADDLEEVDFLACLEEAEHSYLAERRDFVPVATKPKLDAIGYSDGSTS